MTLVLALLAASVTSCYRNKIIKERIDRISHTTNLFTRGVLRAGDTKRDLRAGPKIQRFNHWISRKIQSWEKIKTQRTVSDLLFLHLEEQTNSGKCKNVVHEFI